MLTSHPLSFSMLGNKENKLINTNMENQVLKETSAELSKEKDELVKSQEGNNDSNNSLVSKKTELENNISNLKQEITKIEDEVEQAAIRQKIIDRYGVYVGGQNADVVGTSLQFLGTPYVWGGTSPSGFDCSGLMQYAYGQFGISLSRTTYSQIYDGVEVSSSELLPGDLIFPNPDHVQMYIGNGQVVHAPQPGDVVKISPLSSVWKARRVR